VIYKHFVNTVEKEGFFPAKIYRYRSSMESALQDRYCTRGKVIYSMVMSSTYKSKQLFKVTMLPQSVKDTGLNSTLLMTGFYKTTVFLSKSGVL